MKFLLSILLIALLSFAACLYLPWWSIAIVSFVVTLFLPQHPGKSFLAAFISLFLLWGGIALFMSINNDHNLAHKMSLIILSTANAYLLITVTAFIGGLVAGLAALSAGIIAYRRPSV